MDNSIKNQLKKAGEQIGYNYSAVILAQFVSMPLAIFYISLVAKTLGPERFGYLAIFMATAQLFFCVFANWIRSLVVRFGSEAFATQRDIGAVVGSQGVFILGSYSLALGVLFVFRHQLQESLQLGANSYLWVAAYLGVYIISDITLQLIQARHRLRLYALALLARQISLLGLFYLVFAVLKLLPRLSSIVIIEVFSYLAVFILFFAFAFLQKDILSKLSFSKKRAGEMMRYSWPIIFRLILSYSFIWADIWLIKLFLSLGSVGEYEAANRLMQIVSNVIMPLSVVGFPLVVSLRAIGSISLIRIFAIRIVPQMSFVWSLIIMVLLYNSSSIVNLVLGKGYFSSLLAFQILLVGVSFQILVVLYTTILQAYDWTGRMALVAVVSVAMNLFLDVILIPVWGIAGAAISKTSSLVVCALMYERAALKCLNAKEKNYAVYALLGVPLLSLFFYYLLRGRYLFFPALILFLSAGLIAKRNSIFSSDDLAFWEKIKMPIFAKTVFKRLFLALSR